MILEVEKGGLNILAKTPSLLHKIANEIIWNNKLLCINKKSVYFISTEENLNPEQGFFIMGLINSMPANQCLPIKRATTAPMIDSLPHSQGSTSPLAR